MTWTDFQDMYSGGGRKLRWGSVYIEAPEAEARAVFFSRFGRNPARVTCTCCGEDYSVSESVSLKQATGFHRGCRYLETPRDPETGLYMNDDPVILESLYLDPDDPIPEGYSVGGPFFSKEWQSLEDYCARDDVLVIHASDIRDEERHADIPDEGYVWVLGKATAPGLMVQMRKNREGEA